MGIHIGDNNQISNSNFTSNTNKSQKQNNDKNFFERHPFILTVTSGILIAFIMLFNFWQEIVVFIEKLFK